MVRVPRHTIGPWPGHKDAMTVSESQPAAPPYKLRWYRLTPDRLVIGLLAVEGFLLLSEQFRLFSKGWGVLIALAVVGVTLLLMLLWLAAALLLPWRFQYSLRSLLLLVVAVAIPCSWLATEMQWAKEQRAAVQAVVKSSGSVAYDDQVYESDGKIVEEEERIGPPKSAWLRTLLGNDFFRRVTEIHFGDNDDDRFTDAALENVSGLRSLISLNLNGTQLTDAGLERLVGLRSLISLNLNGTQVTNAGLQYLEGLPHLKQLRLANTRITDAGLERLARLTQLRILRLTNSKVTDAGVKKLQHALPNCEIE